MICSWFPMSLHKIIQNPDLIPPQIAWRTHHSAAAGGTSPAGLRVQTNPLNKNSNNQSHQTKRHIYIYIYIVYIYIYIYVDMNIYIYIYILIQIQIYIYIYVLYTLYLIYISPMDQAVPSSEVLKVWFWGWKYLLRECLDPCKSKACYEY